MNDREALVQNFYDAFARYDADAMAACYADDVVFSDPVFIGLHGSEAGDMWRMLCERAKGDLKVRASGIKTDGDVVVAHWDADYHFGPGRRLVNNSIDARFRFDAEGKISEHTDTFDLHRWSRMAVGLPGLLLGWSPLMQNKIRSQARSQLASYRQKKGRSA